MRQPGFVKHQVFNFAVEHAFDFFNVVDHAVIGALGDRQHARAGVLVGNEWVGINFFLDVFPFKLALGDRPDDAVMIARWHQKHRDRAGQNNGMQDRLVAVPVDHHNVAWRDSGIPDDLVRSGRAIGDEEQMIGVENSCGISLTGRNRTGMVEQLTKLVDRVADVSAQHVLAKKLVEHLSNRALEERHTAGMPRAMP